MHTPLWGRSLPAFGFFAICGLTTELRPLRWLRRQEGEEVTASWTFMMALLLTGSPLGAAAAAAALFAIGDLSSRKPIDRILFNTSQIVLSVSIGALLMDGTGQSGGLWAHHAPGLWWYPAYTAACLIVFATNILLTSAVIALHRGQGFVGVLRELGAGNLSTDGMLLALSPIFVVVSQRSLLLVPLLLVTISTVYRSAQLALTRRHEANHDLLTDLPNRRLFNERLVSAISQAERTGTKVAVVLLDLDGFKEINDRLGHHTGDNVLIHVGRRLNAARRPADLLARLGGDEFAMIVPGIDRADTALQAARRLQATFSQPCISDGFPISVGVSIGVALLPDHADDDLTLLRRADEAMYSAKRNRTGVVLYRPSGNEATIGRLGLMADLANAVGSDELFLEYQPQVSLATGAVVGVEALCRWRHPFAGVIAPDTFMPLAEQTELIGLITEWVLRAALVQEAAWLAAGVEVDIAVNVSARDIQNVRFPALVAKLLDATGVPAERLNLEITESTASLDLAATEVVLGELRQLGVTVSVDDFGTGFSSLAQLRDLRFDEIKVDRSFVSNMASDPRDGLIVQSILQLGNALGVRTIAEGVEDPLVVDLLRDMRCDRAQGFLFGAPGPAEAITRRMLTVPRDAPAPTAPRHLEVTG